MFKIMFALLAFISMTACLGLDQAEVTRDYTGSLTGCAGRTGVSAQYSQSVAGMPVRCGPQSVLPVTLR